MTMAKTRLLSLLAGRVPTASPWTATGPLLTRLLSVLDEPDRAFPIVTP
ncbi:hypothetical protein AB0E81_32900 [Streptomyces sp. NPDC033538]